MVFFRYILCFFIFCNIYNKLLNKHKMSFSTDEEDNGVESGDSTDEEEGGYLVRRRLDLSYEEY